MIGWRLGWVCGHERIVQAFADVKDNSDSGQFIAIQKAAAAALDDTSDSRRKCAQKYRRRLEKLVAVLSRVRLHLPHAGRNVFSLHAEPQAASPAARVSKRPKRPASI